MKLDLFAYRFKGHKRCAHIIARSHKHKQLGLRVHRQKINEGNMHLRDEDLNVSDMKKVQDSDDETLLSLIKGD